MGSNYQDYAAVDDRPPYYGREDQAYYDEGQGIPQMNENNMTVQDIFRTGFAFTHEHKKNWKNLGHTALKGIQTNTQLSKIFFADENIKRIQRKIRKSIRTRTNNQFRLDVDQDVKELLIAMRAVYMEHARNLPGQVVRQVKRLNEKVIDEIVPGIITNIKQDYGYLKEINKPLNPIQLPINVSNKGRLTLPSTTSVLGFD